MIIGCAGFFLLAAVLARGIKIDKEQCDVLCDEIHRVKAVSYTHLDVYKRQTLYYE